MSDILTWWKVSVSTVSNTVFIVTFLAATVSDIVYIVVRLVVPVRVCLLDPRQAKSDALKALPVCCERFGAAATRPHLTAVGRAKTLGSRIRGSQA
jgi:hypothetical protein